MLESVVKSTSTETFSDLIGSGALWAGTGGVVCVSGVVPGAELLPDAEAVPVAGFEFVASGAVAVAGVDADGASCVVLLAAVSDCVAEIVGSATELTSETVAFVVLFASVSAMRC